MFEQNQRCLTVWPSHSNHPVYWTDLLSMFLPVCQNNVYGFTQLIVHIVWPFEEIILVILQINKIRNSTQGVTFYTLHVSIITNKNK